MRIGLIFKKAGSNVIFDEATGVRTHVTLLKLHDSCITALKTKEKDGYSAIQVGTSNVKRMKKPQMGYFTKVGIEPKGKLVEFRVSSTDNYQLGQKLDVAHFKPGQKVDVTGTSIGKGFAGVMKRHNFAGLRASHGVSASHRSPGSTGQCQDPGRVMKGKKMAGHMGAVRSTIRNLQVVAINQEHSFLVVKGAVPGNKGEYVMVRDALKHRGEWL